MVFGGRTKHKEESTTEVMSNSTSTFKYGTKMPYATQRFCALKVNSTHVFLAGGFNNEGFLSDAYFYKRGKYGTFEKLPGMREARASHACGLAKGADVVVAGGKDENYEPLDSVEISLEKRSWRSGPKLPRAMEGLVPVQLGDTFVVIGGRTRNTGEYYRDVYQFDEESYGWKERAEKMGHAVSHFNAVVLSKEPKLCVQATSGLG